MKLATWIGRRAAEVITFLRDKPFVPCQVSWDYRGEFVEPLTENRKQKWPCE